MSVGFGRRPAPVAGHSHRGGNAPKTPRRLARVGEVVSFRGTGAFDHATRRPPTWIPTMSPAGRATQTPSSAPAVQVQPYLFFNGRCVLPALRHGRRPLRRALDGLRDAVRSVGLTRFPWQPARSAHLLRGNQRAAQPVALSCPRSTVRAAGHEQAEAQRRRVVPSAKGATSDMAARPGLVPLRGIAARSPCGRPLSASLRLTKVLWALMRGDF